MTTPPDAAAERPLLDQFRDAMRSTIRTANEHGRYQSASVLANLALADACGRWAIAQRQLLELWKPAGPPHRGLVPMLPAAVPQAAEQFWLCVTRAAQVIDESERRGPALVAEARAAYEQLGRAHERLAVSVAAIADVLDAAGERLRSGAAVSQEALPHVPTAAATLSAWRASPKRDQARRPAGLDAETIAHVAVDALLTAERVLPWAAAIDQRTSGPQR